MTNLSGTCLPNSSGIPILHIKQSLSFFMKYDFVTGICLQWTRYLQFESATAYVGCEWTMTLWNFCVTIPNPSERFGCNSWKSRQRIKLQLKLIASFRCRWGWSRSLFSNHLVHSNESSSIPNVKENVWNEFIIMLNAFPCSSHKRSAIKLAVCVEVVFDRFIYYAVMTLWMEALETDRQLRS